MEDVLSSCLKFLKQAIPAFGMTIDLYNEESNTFNVIGIASSEGIHEVNLTFRLPPELRYVAEWHEESSIRMVGDPKNDSIVKMGLETLFPYFKDDRLSTLVMRLNVKETRRVADVCLYAKGLNRYNSSHISLFRMLNKPFAIAVANFLTHRKLRLSQELLFDDNQYLRNEVIELTGQELIGSSTGLHQVTQMIRHVAPLDSPVLLTGETGVGKEVVANAIQQNSNRREKPFVKVNCGAIPPSLIDSEFFGHEKGAFTGAANLRRGRFELANGGTIFLDEIGEMPLSVQVRLLRVLQDGIVERIGGTRPIKVDIRVIAATHRDIPCLIKSGQFRQDLFFRLNVFPIHIPPLRERSRDIPTLTNYFIERICQKMNRPLVTELMRGSMGQLLKYAWPGNVRELKNIIERSLILHKSGPLRLLSPETDQGHLNPESIDSHTESLGILPLDVINTAHIKKALQASGGKISGPGGAAEMLRVNPNTLRKRMEKLGVPFGRRTYP